MKTLGAPDGCGEAFDTDEVWRLAIFSSRRALLFGVFPCCTSSEEIGVKPGDGGIVLVGLSVIVVDAEDVEVEVMVLVDVEVVKAIDVDRYVSVDLGSVIVRTV